MTESVRLLEVRGATTCLIDAEINDAGDLVISGQDLGKAPKEFWGDDEYEYWLVVKAAHKDRLLLALLEKHYSGNNYLVSELKAYLESKGIPCEFASYP